MSFEVPNAAEYRIIADTSLLGVSATPSERLWHFTYNSLSRVRDTLYTNKRDLLNFDFSGGVVYGDCSSLVEALLAVAAPEALLEIRREMKRPDGKRMFAKIFALFFVSIRRSPLWVLVPDFRKARKGDILSVMYAAPSATGSGGHIMVIGSTPKKTASLEGTLRNFLVPTGIDQLYQFTVLHEAGKEGKKPGFSKKTKWARIDSSGRIVSIRNSPSGRFTEYAIMVVARLRN